MVTRAFISPRVWHIHDEDKQGAKSRKGRRSEGAYAQGVARRFGITVIIPEGSIDQWHGSPSRSLGDALEFWQRLGRGFQQRMAGLGVIVFRQRTSARTGDHGHPFQYTRTCATTPSSRLLNAVRYDQNNTHQRRTKRKQKKPTYGGYHHRTRGKHRHMNIWDIPAKDLGRED